MRLSRKSPDALGTEHGLSSVDTPGPVVAQRKSANPGMRWSSHKNLQRWLLDGTRVTQLALDNQLSRSTGYAYLH